MFLFLPLYFLRGIAHPSPVQLELPFLRRQTLFLLVKVKLFFCLIIKAIAYISGSDLCVPCKFLNYDSTNISNQYCPFMEILCPERTDSRLIVDIGISCSQIIVYYAPISAVMFIGIVIGIPGIQ